MVCSLNAVSEIFTEQRISEYEYDRWGNGKGIGWVLGFWGSSTFQMPGFSFTQCNKHYLSISAAMEMKLVCCSSLYLGSCEF